MVLQVNPAENLVIKSRLAMSNDKGEIIIFVTTDHHDGAIQGL